MEQLRGMEETVNEIRDALRRKGGITSAGNSTNTINMGSGERGIWICVVLCAMMMSGLVMGAFWMSREFNRYDIALSERKEEGDRSQTYLSSIYGRMPQWMREEVEKEASAKIAAKEKKDAK